MRGVVSNGVSNSVANTLDYAWNPSVDHTTGGYLSSAGIGLATGAAGSLLGVMARAWWLDRRNRRSGGALSAGEGRGGRGVEAGSGTR